MISFITIGLNEALNLKRCFESIYKSIIHSKINKYEIIYIDSKSSDNSIEIVKQFKEVIIFQIAGQCNAAIARNIGASEAKGTILFFIDADMELQPQFLSTVLNEKQELNKQFSSGKIIDITSGTKNELRSSDDFLPGGIFLIGNKEWKLVRGMRTKFQTGEDLDLGLRLYKQNIHLNRTRDVIAYHHTIPYLGKSRIWKTIKNKYFFCSRCVLYRNHLFNLGMYRLLWSSDKTFILLLFSLAIGFTFPSFLILPVSLYFISIVVRSLKQNKAVSIFELILYFISFDILNLLYLIILFPKNKIIKYKNVKTFEYHYMSN